jgi:glycosyltransferase involved in cell wall biosynthesis
MDISFSTPLINLRESNGYGYATQNIVKSLNNLGYRVPFQNPKAPVQINFSQPEHFKLHRNQYQIGYTPWESTSIPVSWKPFMEACDELWTTSDWCANVFEDNGFKNIKVYPHGIDPMWKPYRRQNDGVIKFLHVGEPAPRKAGQDVVNAFIELFGNKEGYSLTLKVYNNNTTRVFDNYINKGIVGLPNEMYNNIFIIDEILNDEDLVKLYYDHDVLVYPSYGEGFGVPTIEAQACGVPVIVSDFTASAELCGDGWKVSGQPLWDAYQKAFFQIPFVPEIVDALEESYKRGRSTSKKAIEFAKKYEADTVYRDCWKPALDSIFNKIGTDSPKTA